MGCKLVTGRYFLRDLHGENRPKSENWSTLKPRSFATVRRPDIGNCLVFRLQRGIKNISVVYPVACSLWGTCLTPQSLGFWGQMTPEWKLFINFCPNSAFDPRFTCRGRIWRKSAVAKPKSRLVLHTKKDTRSGHFLIPLSPPLSRSRP